jgi:hypothetical protein
VLFDFFLIFHICGLLQKKSWLLFIHVHGCLPRLRKNSTSKQSPAGLCMCAYVGKYVGILLVEGRSVQIQELGTKNVMLKWQRPGCQYYDFVV